MAQTQDDVQQIKPVSDPKQIVEQCHQMGDTLNVLMQQKATLPNSNEWNTLREQLYEISDRLTYFARSKEEIYILQQRRAKLNPHALGGADEYLAINQQEAKDADTTPVKKAAEKPSPNAPAPAAPAPTPAATTSTSTSKK